MQGKVTIFKDIWETKQPHFITVELALERIKDGKSYDLITAIRNEKDDKARGELKKKLPSVCWSGTFRERSDKALLEHSGLAIFDFDKVGQAQYLKEELQEDPFIFAAWVSPSGNGLKVLVKIPPVIDDHRLYYGAILDHFPTAGRDDSNINESRVCYESYDKDLYVNWNSQVWTEKKLNESIEAPEAVQGEKIKDPERIYSILKKWMDRTDTFIEGNRHNFYVKFAFNLCECGIDLETSVEWLLRDYPHENEDGAENAIKSGWQSKKAAFGSKGFEDRSKDKDSYLTFWDVAEVNESTKVFFNRLKFIDWLQSQGISRYKFADGKWIYVLIKDQVARQIYRPEIKHICFSYIETLPQEFDGVYRAQVLEMMAKGVNSYFSDELLDLLAEMPISWNRDNENSCYFYYQNTVVKVTPKGICPMPYKDLPNVIWDSQIIDRAFVLSKRYENDFRTFCKNVCGGDDQRYESLKSIIGYLLTDHKDPNEFPTVVLMDEQISDHPEGGTGKGLFSKAIRAIKGGVVIDGKNWSTDKSFAWQRIDLDTKLVILEDVVKKFDFEKFYSITAEGIEVEKKNQQSFYIPFDESPKLIITTNYTIQGEGGSTGRRICEIEFSPYYSIEFTPRMEFGKLLFDHWSDNEWNSFDNYMLGCVVYYLKIKETAKDKEGKLTGRGIVKPLDINKSERKLTEATGEEFILWAEGNIALGTKYDRKHLFHYFLDANKEFTKLTPRTFNKWLASWSNYRGYLMTKSKSGNDFFYTFTAKGEEAPEVIEDDELPF